MNEGREPLSALLGCPSLEEAQMLLELRYQEHLARLDLQALFEGGLSGWALDACEVNRLPDEASESCLNSVWVHNVLRVEPVRLAVAAPPAAAVGKRSPH
jgi:hypothetical protein